MSKKHKKTTKSEIDWKSIIINMIADVVVGIILILIEYYLF